MIDGIERVAKIGSVIGDTIYVNLDLIYQKDEQDNTKVMDISAATAMLVHEIGHHIDSSVEHKIIVPLRCSLLLEFDPKLPVKVNYQRQGM